MTRQKWCIVQPYEVHVNRTMLKEVINKGYLEPEKVVVLEDLKRILENSNYELSTHYSKHGKTNDVVRYDYLSSDILIGGEPFTVRFDIETFVDRNNVHNYAVINEINLSNADGEVTSLLPKATTTSANLDNVSSATRVPERFINSSIDQLSNNVNASDLNDPPKMVHCSTNYHSFR